MRKEDPFSVFPGHPAFIQLETTIACNAACPFCPQKEVDRSPYRMEERLWRRVVDETRGLGVTYRPFLQNEPLCDNRLGEIVRYIKGDPTARVELNTNGELLSEKRARKLLESGLDEVRFSIDAFSTEVYEKTRPGIDRDTVYERVTRFCELAGETACLTHVRMIEMPENAGEREIFGRYWEPLADLVEFVPLYRWPWTSQTEKDVVLKPCKKILSEMFFFTDGRAVLCCWDVEGRGVIGDVNLNTVLEIWNGPVVGNYRELLSRGERNKIWLCSRCDAYAHLDWKPPE
jgi:sulfatase maturation enzyme AslB (radical SAM superfamily)